MNRPTRMSFFLTVHFGLLANLVGGEVCVCPPMVVSQPVITTVYKPLRVAPGVVLEQVPIRQVSAVAEVSSLPVAEERRTVAKPPSAPVFDETAPEVPVPTPPPPMGPFEPIEPMTVRGQSPGLWSTLEERPPPPEGTISDSSVIPAPLLAESDAVAVLPSDPVVPSADPARAQLTNGMLLIVTVFALGLLFYVVAIAFDYRQRWMQALTSQNSRLLPSFDDASLGFAYSDDADLYGGGFRRFRTDEL